MKLIKKLDLRFKNKRNRRYGLFLCKECGNKIEKPYDNGIKQNNCGCLKKPAMPYGEGKRIYNSWWQMISRCNNKKHVAYHNYGRRGIKVCNEWMDYKTFRSWALSNGYNAKLFIDRIDNNGNYEPENCRFVTNAENSRNRRDNKLTHDDVIRIRKLCSISGIKCRNIAKIFNVTVSTIYHVKNGTTWS